MCEILITFSDPGTFKISTEINIFLTTRRNTRTFLNFYFSASTCSGERIGINIT
jgi:hypothetical protein